MRKIDNRIIGLMLLVLAALGASGCKVRSAPVVPAPASKPAVAAPQPVNEPPAPPPAITPGITQPPAAEPAKAMPISKTMPTPIILEVAEKKFRAGDYKQAVQSYEMYLKVMPNSKDCEQALFYSGLSYLLASEPDKNMRKADAAFKKLIADFPKSAYSRQAAFILGLQEQVDKLRSEMKERDEKIKKLNDEINKIKEIDIKRRPAK
jgi:TolA-binding protein